MTEPLEVRETHTAWVLLTRDRAIKVKKPVRFGFVDLTTAAARRRFCLEEQRVNAELAPGLVLGIRGFLGDRRRFELTGLDDPRAEETAVVMRRFDERRTLAGLLGEGALTAAQIELVARRLAAFHRDAEIASGAGDRLIPALEQELRELRELLDGEPALDRLARATAWCARAHGTALEERARRGLIRDGHGDLRAEHVVFEEPLMIVDRLEFDPRLRTVDVGADLAFLLMDLEALGARRAARALVRDYRAAGGDPGSDALLAAFAMQRALVRTKVALLRTPPLHDAAATCLRLAERFAWRAHGPLALAVSGPPGSGKSTLAAALAERSGFDAMSSDRVRKSRATPPDYSEAGRLAIYGALGTAARDVLDRDGGVIVDATFGTREQQRAFTSALGGGVALHAVACHAPLAVCIERTRAREAAGGGDSDAGPAVATALAETAQPFAAARVLDVDSTRSVPALVDDVQAWLDTA